MEIVQSSEHQPTGFGFESYDVKDHVKKNNWSHEPGLWISPQFELWRET